MNILDEDDDWDDAALLSTIDSLENSHYQKLQQQRKPPITVAPSASHWNCAKCTLENNGASCLACGHVPISSATISSWPIKYNSNSASRSLNNLKNKVMNTASINTQKAPIAQSSVSKAVHQNTISWANAANTTKHATSSTDDVRSKIMSHFMNKDDMLVPDDVATQPDRECIKDWIYPTNYPIRDYQLSITTAALYQNTIVCLPTGLGKTLIASVLMYNYYRWFPCGKVIFMAPTKPLVSQQIKACHQIMGVPQIDTAELQGEVPPVKRKELWHTKRVFFCTPQSIQRDIARGYCNPEKIVCIVVDEAHRATGNYAYAAVLREIEKKTSFFRVLALSATPGSKFESIQEVLTNLKISHIECKSADDPDVKRYVHTRQEEVIVCKLSPLLSEIKQKYFRLIEQPMRRLNSVNVLSEKDPDKLSRYKLIIFRDNFHKGRPANGSKDGFYYNVQQDFNLLITLIHGKTLLTGHGIGSFNEFLNNMVLDSAEGKRMSRSKRELLKSDLFQELLNLIGKAGIGKNGGKSHPKLVKLREVLTEHFERHAAGNNLNTKAIIFTQYRDSVFEIIQLLQSLQPLLRAQPFIGQGTSSKGREGQSQKQQKEVIRLFREGSVNILVATCIGEEGLDIGEVDLIVSFDALTSPVRMIQRMGRTGRKRVGKVLILVTEGDEQQKLRRSVALAKTVSRSLTINKKKFKLFAGPRMIPDGIYPSIIKRQIEVSTFQLSQVGGRKCSSGRTKKHQDLFYLTEAEEKILRERYVLADGKRQYTNTVAFSLCAPQSSSMKRTYKIGHSRKTAALSHILGFIHTQKWKRLYGEEEMQSYALEEHSDILVNEGGTKCRKNSKKSASTAIIGNQPMDQYMLASSGLESKLSTEENSQPLMDMDWEQGFDYIPPSPLPEKEQFIPVKHHDEVKDPSRPIKSAKGLSQNMHSDIEATADVFTSKKAPIELSIDSIFTKKIEAHDLKFNKKEKSSSKEDSVLLIKRGKSVIDLLEELEESEIAEKSSSEVVKSSVEVSIPKEIESIEEEKNIKIIFPKVFSPDLQQDMQNKFNKLDIKTVDTFEMLAELPDHSTKPSQTPNLILNNKVSNASSNERVRKISSINEKEEISAPVTQASRTSNNTIEIDSSSSDDSNEPIQITTDTNANNVATHLPVLSQSKCSVCDDDTSFEDDVILFCDRCNLSVHQYCYGVETIPLGNWFCQLCQYYTRMERHSKNKKTVNCCLCPIQNGALKKTSCGKWAHIQCFLWIPELCIKDNFDLGDCARLDPDRKKLVCDYCFGRGGGIVQCALKKCLAAFHVSCAFQEVDCTFLQKKTAESSIEFLVYCKLHLAEANSMKAIIQKNCDSNGCISRDLPLTPSALLGSPFDTNRRSQKKRSFKRLKQAIQLSAKKNRDKNIKRSKEEKLLRKHACRQYLDFEAEDDESGDDGSDEEENDCFNLEDSFIDDSTQLSMLSPAAHSPSSSKLAHFQSPDFMQGVYLRSLHTSPPCSDILVGRNKQIPKSGVIHSVLATMGQTQGESEMDCVNEIVHIGFSCDDCGLDPIEGPRYHCQQCVEYDLCMCCYSQRYEIHQANHTFQVFESPEQNISENEDGSESDQELFPSFKLNTKYDKKTVYPVGASTSLGMSKKVARPVFSYDTMDGKTMEFRDSNKRKASVESIDALGSCNKKKYSEQQCDSLPSTKKNHLNNDDHASSIKSSTVSINATTQLNYSSTDINKNNLRTVHARGSQVQETSTLSEEQRLRIEENRKKAQARKLQRMEENRQKALLKLNKKQADVKSTNEVKNTEVKSGGCADFPTFNLFANQPNPLLKAVVDKPFESTAEHKSVKELNPSFMVAPVAEAMEREDERLFMVVASPRIMKHEASLCFRRSKDIGFSVDKTLEVEYLLSVRVAAIFPTFMHVQKLFTQNNSSFEKHIRKLIELYFEVIIVIEIFREKNNNPSQNVKQEYLRKSMKVQGLQLIFSDSTSDTYMHLVHIASQEHKQKFSIQNHPIRDTVSNGLNNLFLVNISGLSVGSRIAILQRFGSKKLQEIVQCQLEIMDWKRMFPWISDHSLHGLISKIKSSV